MSAEAVAPHLDAPVVRLPVRDLTLDDVAALAAGDGARRYELSTGTLSVLPPADSEHNALVIRLLVWLAGTVGTARLQAGTGVRLTGRATGRIPDLMVLREPPAGATARIDAAQVLLVVEVVSPGSEALDRVLEPAEYAAAGIEHYWRVERGHGAATVHRATLGTGADGTPAYVPHPPVLVDDLLAGPPPAH